MEEQEYILLLHLHLYLRTKLAQWEMLGTPTPPSQLVNLPTRTLGLFLQIRIYQHRRYAFLRVEHLRLVGRHLAYFPSSSSVFFATFFDFFGLSNERHTALPIYSTATTPPIVANHVSAEA